MPRFILTILIALFGRSLVGGYSAKAQSMQPIKNDLGKYRLSLLPSAKLIDAINQIQQSNSLHFNELLKKLDFQIVYTSRPRYEVNKNYRFHQLIIGLNLSRFSKNGFDSSFYNSYSFISSQHIGMARYAWNWVRLRFNGQRSRATKTLRQQYNESELSLTGYFAAPRWSQDSSKYEFYASQIQLTYLKSQTSYWNWCCNNGYEQDFYLRYGFALNFSGYYLQNALAGSLEAYYPRRPLGGLPILAGAGVSLFLQLQWGNEKIRELFNVTAFTNLNLFFERQNQEHIIMRQENQPFAIRWNLPLSFFENYGKTMYTRDTPID